MKKKKKALAKCGHKIYPQRSTEKMATETDTTIKLRVSDDFKENVESFASTREISVSALTRIALAEYIEKHRPPQQETKNEKGEAA